MIACDTQLISSVLELAETPRHMTVSLSISIQVLSNITADSGGAG